MKFLITGAYGFVGTNLCKYLVGKGHECIALDIPAAKREGVPYAAFFSWDELDQLPPCDVVVHLAGKAHDLKKVASEQSYFDINVGLTQRIYEAFRKEVEKVGGQRKFIYFSSSKASADGNAYGRSKLAAEKWLEEQSLTTNNQQLTTIILRPAMIHGPGNKGNLNLLWGIARRGLPWPLAAFENRRSFTSIGNICAAVEALAALPNEKCEMRNEKLRNDTSDIAHSSLLTSHCNCFAVADDETLSTNRLIELIAETCGRKAKLWRIPQGLMRFAAKMGDILHLPLNTERIEKLTEDSFVDNAALKAALGWSKMPIAAEDGMRATLASFRK